MNVLLIAWLHVLRVVSVQFLTHDGAGEHLLHSTSSSPHNSLVSCLHLLLLAIGLAVLFLLLLPAFLDLVHPPAQIIEFKVGSCLGTLVLLACVLIGVDAFVVLEVDLVAVILHRQAIWSCSLCTIVFVNWLSLSVGSAVVIVLTRVSLLLVLRSHFVKFE